MAHQPRNEMEAAGTTLLIGVASICVFVDTQRQVMKSMTESLADQLDQTLAFLRNNEGGVKLFRVDEEHEETLPIKTNIDPRRPSQLFQRLSAVKVDKEADRRMEIEESQYIERSTFDDVCGEAYVVATDIDNAEEIFDDTMTQPQQQQDAGRKSIVVSVRKVPDFLGPNLNQDSFQSKLDELRKQYEDRWSETSDVEYNLTNYNTNESSNIDDYKYSWQESSSKKDQLFQVDPRLLQGGVFDFPMLISQETRGPESMPREEGSPKKRLVCNRKKVPHWAENDQVVLERFSQQQMKPNAFLQSQMKQVEHKVLFPQLPQIKRGTKFFTISSGSSADWRRNKANGNNHMKAMEQLIKQIHYENVQAPEGQSGVKQRLYGLIKSVKKIWSHDQD